MKVRYGAADDYEDDEGHDDSNDRSKKNKKKRKMEEMEKCGADESGHTTMPVEEVKASSNVGYGYDDAYKGFILLRCPLKVVSHREGIHACNPSGKESLSAFKMLNYDRVSDTSLVICRPITGRTHQLRLHLQLLGNPIANDPCYGGSLFYGEEEKRQKAARALKRMQDLDLQPLSRIPHFDTTLTEDASSMAKIAEEGGAKREEGKDDKGHDKWDENEGSDERREGESTEEYLSRTCRYCRAERTSGMADLEAALHCDGIWLHAWQYKGASGWQFRTEIPDWAATFGTAIDPDAEEEAKGLGEHVK